MGCNCKTGENGERTETGFGRVDNKHIAFTNHILFKLILFLISIPILTILYPFIILVLFKTIVLNNSTINATSFLNKFAKRINSKDKDEEDEEDDTSNEDIDPDDYEMVEKVDVIK